MGFSRLVSHNCLALGSYLKIEGLTEEMETVINHEQMLIFNLIFFPFCPHILLISS